MPPFVRFAPSPTGYLHVGNVRTALVNWLFARKAGGKFMLRLDDTDTERSRTEFAEAILEDMEWLGLHFDQFRKQSGRMEAYINAKHRLITSGRLYPCYETQEELDIRRKLQAGRGLPPVYDRAALKLTDADRANFKAEGRRPHYRFLMQDTPVIWQDLVRGEVRFQGGHMSDPVLVREDGVPLYTLASVVDDGEMGITHVIRGEDHVSNTAVQWQIFEALGFTPPAFGHLALLKTKEGELSKRVGGNDIRSLREVGINPMAVTSLLARLGTRDPVTPFFDMDTLTAQFDLSHFGRAPANYDVSELERLNGRLMSALPYGAVAAKLQALGIPDGQEMFWHGIRGNIAQVSEAREWWEILHNPPAYVPGDDAKFLAEAASLLPREPWDETLWPRWMDALKQATGRRGKDLFHPLRLAITGREQGPELKILLPILGYAATRARLVP